MMAVVLKDIVKKFGDFTAVNHISLEVAEGEIFGFLGPNGAGKSTTIRILCGLLKPTSGQGSVNGLDVVKGAEKIKTRLGYMSQKFSLYEDLRVEENMHFFGGVYGLGHGVRSKRVEEVLDLTDLRDRRKQMTRDLPGGIKQRLALGCALLHKPPIIFLDEPTSGVDPDNRRNFWKLIYTLADEKVTVFVTTHYMEEAEYCHRIALINHGKLIAMGAPEQLKTESIEGDVYDVETADVLGAVESLAGVESVLNAAVFGRSMHVRVASGVDAESLLTGHMKARELAIGRIRRIRPSLEDVFVALVG